jgi:tetratricopeptide (TPR) repeat protein
MRTPSIRDHAIVILLAYWTNLGRPIVEFQEFQTRFDYLEQSKTSSKRDIGRLLWERLHYWQKTAARPGHPFNQLGITLDRKKEAAKLADDIIVELDPIEIGAILGLTKHSLDVQLNLETRFCLAIVSSDQGFKVAINELETLAKENQASSIFKWRCYAELSYFQQSTNVADAERNLNNMRRTFHQIEDLHRQTPPDQEPMVSTFEMREMRAKMEIWQGRIHQLRHERTLALEHLEKGLRTLSPILDDYEHKSTETDLPSISAAAGEHGDIYTHLNRTGVINPELAAYSLIALGDVYCQHHLTLENNGWRYQRVPPKIEELKLGLKLIRLARRYFEQTVSLRRQVRAMCSNGWSLLQYAFTLREKDTIDLTALPKDEHPDTLVEKAIELYDDAETLRITLRANHTGYEFVGRGAINLYKAQFESKDESEKYLDEAEKWFGRAIQNATDRDNERHRCTASAWLSDVYRYRTIHIEHTSTSDRTASNQVMRTYFESRIRALETARDAAQAAGQERRSNYFDQRILEIKSDTTVSLTGP